MLRKNPALWVSLIGILVLLNLARWGPALWSGKNAAGREASGWMRLDFPGPLGPGDQKIRRDLFTLGVRTSGGGRGKRVAKAPPPRPPLPPASPTPSFPDGSVLEVDGGYRLMGVVSRGNSSHALIGRGTQLFQVAPGEDLEGRYQVQSITQNEVYLTEKQTGNTLKLRIWDQTAEGTPGPQAQEGSGIHDND